jgi:hypothetical protein
MPTSQDGGSGRKDSIGRSRRQCRSGHWEDAEFPDDAGVNDDTGGSTGEGCPDCAAKSSTASFSGKCAWKDSVDYSLGMRCQAGIKGGTAVKF